MPVVQNPGVPMTFSFGQNWQKYVSCRLTPQCEEIALNSLTEFVGRNDFRGLSFLDIGCGSGLFSLAALRLGASRIVSLDVDTSSVECTESLRRAAGTPDHWKVMEGSILDQTAIANLEPADIVYAWGSLHHTGNMWDAIRNTSRLIAPGGVFYLGIYNRFDGRGGSKHWLEVKRRYNRSSKWKKRSMEIGYVLRHQALPSLVRLKSPFAIWRNYQKTRGMDHWTDVRDWLGGYPYEFATTDEIFRFCVHQLGLKLLNLRASNHLGVNEFLFTR
jgi:SAM-dependent methyltransferase